MTRGQARNYAANGCHMHLDMHPVGHLGLQHLLHSVCTIWTNRRTTVNNLLPAGNDQGHYTSAQHTTITLKPNSATPALPLIAAQQTEARLAPGPLPA